MVEELTAEQKIKQLATWSSKFRAGMAQMIEEGFDPDELDASIEAAEVGYQEQQRARAKRLRTKRSVGKF